MGSTGEANLVFSVSKAPDTVALTCIPLSNRIPSVLDAPEFM